MYCFAPNKQQSAYVRILQLIKEHASMINLTLNPKKCSCDFEMGMLNAFGTVFPEIEIKGCLFHRNQGFRQVQELGLVTMYKKNEQFKMLIRKFNALSLLPVDLIESAFELISTQIDEQFRDTEAHPKILEFIAYFRSTWVVRPLFPKGIWNNYRTKRRTINDLEGFHNKFNQQLEGKHRSDKTVYISDIEGFFEWLGFLY